MIWASAMVLWTTFAILTAAALAAVLWPYLRPAKQEFEAAEYDAVVFKDQLGEVDADEARGIISSSEAEAARTEVSRRLLSVAGGRDNAKLNSVNKRNGNIPALALTCAFVCLPVLSGTLYLINGSPHIPDQPLTARLNVSTDQQKVGPLVARVEARLRQFPEDGRGWEVLAPVYMRQRRYAEAADAFGKALRILGETPRRFADFGVATVLADDGIVGETARKAMQEAVSGNPALVEAHFWLAVAKEQDGRFLEAASDWRALLKRGNAESPWVPMVEERLAGLVQREGIAPVEQTAAKPLGEALTGPTRDDIAAAGEMSSSDRSAMIKQMISRLAERLKSDGGSIEEWKRLIKSYTVFGDKQAARTALGDAKQTFAEDSGALASLGKLAGQLGL